MANEEKSPTSISKVYNAVRISCLLMRGWALWLGEEEKLMLSGDLRQEQN